MSKNEQKTIAVRNTEARVRVLAARTSHKTAQGVEKVEARPIAVLPGLNFLDAAEVAKCCAKGELADLEIATGGALEIVDGPHAMSAHEAVRLVGETSSKAVLEAWRSEEKRDRVIQEIDKALAKRN